MLGTQKSLSSLGGLQISACVVLAICVGMYRRIFVGHVDVDIYVIGWWKSTLLAILML
jgi:hypothetical protein